ncbi:hypothetical protein CDAR_550401 [Caerostris darwini]|uniref:Uncharacterized protein n=1 Tax=Caerostris darwini TaxID=1538125 RepID=A0AAV4XAN0_9ARAC|nr:hypothetical protein CDAR_550401 [Caerostris darwini]
MMMVRGLPCQSVAHQCAQGPGCGTTRGYRQAWGGVSAFQNRLQPPLRSYQPPPPSTCGPTRSHYPIENHPNHTYRTTSGYSIFTKKLFTRDAPRIRTYTRIQQSDAPLLLITYGTAQNDKRQLSSIIHFDAGYLNKLDGKNSKTTL